MISINLFFLTLYLFVANIFLPMASMGQRILEKKDVRQLNIILKELEKMDVQKSEEFLDKLDYLKNLSEYNKYGEGIVQYLKIIEENSEEKLLFQAALDSGQSVIDRNMKLLNERQYYESLFLLAQTSLKSSMSDRTIKILNLLGNKLDKLEDIGRYNYLKAYAYNNLAVFDQSIYHYFLAIECFTELDDKKRLYLAYNGLGVALYHNNEFGKSLEFYKKSYEIAKELDNEEFSLKSYSNLGVAYNKLNEKDSALFYYQKGLELSKVHNIPNQIAQNLMNIGNIYFNDQKYVQALEYYQNSLEVCYVHEIKYGILLNYINIGGANIMTRNFSKAKRSLDSAVFYADKLNLPNEKSKAYFQMAELWEAQGMFEKAYRVFKLHHELEKELFNSSKQEKIDDLMIKYEATLKDLDLMNNELLLKERNGKINLFGFFLAFLSLITLFSFTFLWFMNRKVKDLYKINLYNLKKWQQINQDSHVAHQEMKDPLHEIYLSIIRLIESDEVYKNPELSITWFAQKLNTNDKYISNAINNFSKKNFNNLVNDYRINEAKRQIVEFGDLTLNEIMFACGFNSRTTFYYAFQKHTGMSPKQFKDLVLKDNKQLESD